MLILQLQEASLFSGVNASGGKSSHFNNVNTLFRAGQQPQKQEPSRAYLPLPGEGQTAPLSCEKTQLMSPRPKPLEQEILALNFLEMERGNDRLQKQTKQGVKPSSRAREVSLTPASKNTQKTLRGPKVPQGLPPPEGAVALKIQVRQLLCIPAPDSGIACR